MRLSEALTRRATGATAAADATAAGRGAAPSSSVRGAGAEIAEIVERGAICEVGNSDERATCAPLFDGCRMPC
jgi:hypothetical protein